MTENLSNIRNRVLKDTVSKNEDGTVYGNHKGHIGNHLLGILAFKDNKSLLEYIDKLEKAIEDNAKVIELLKTATLTSKDKIDELERKLSAYGLE